MEPIALCREMQVMTLMPITRLPTPMILKVPDYTFNNINVAAFTENIFRLGKRFTITPGIRFEYINTASDGYYKLLTKDFAGNVIVDSNIYGSEQNIRSFVIGGIGMSFKLNSYLEFYGNISQNYRAVNFNDIRIVNPNSKVIPI